jgi:tol-pal system protein YbgF
MRTLQRMFLIFLLCVIAAGCASRGDVESVQYDANNALKRITSLEKNYKEEREAALKGIADLQAAQDTIRVDMREMSGKIDDLQLLVQKRTDDKAFQKEDTEKRISALEDKLQKLEKRLGESIGGESLSREAPATPENIYKSGLSLFKAGDMQKARAAFTQFVEQNPKDELAPNALYWIGETYFGEKKYDQAVLAFQEVIKKYPKKEKTPPALLKQALSFKALGDAKNARYVLKKLRDDYPRTEEAKHAKSLLKGL